MTDIIDINDLLPEDKVDLAKMFNSDLRGALECSYVERFPDPEERKQAVDRILAACKSEADYIRAFCGAISVLHHDHAHAIMAMNKQLQEQYTVIVKMNEALVDRKQQIEALIEAVNNWSAPTVH